MSLRFEVLDGPMHGSVFEFRRRDSFLFGRAADCHCALPDDPYVSRHHFVVETNPPACVIKDVGSRNGVVVNDVRYGVPATGDEDSRIELFLKHGDCIQVGHTRIRVVVLEDAPCAHCGKKFSPRDQTAGIWKDGRFECARCSVDHPASPAPRTSSPTPTDMLPGAVETEAEEGLPQIPGFRVLRQLGRGFYTSVFLARDLNDGAPVALRLQPVDDSEMVDRRLRRLKHDVEICEGVRHLNVVRWERGSAQGRLALYRLPYWPMGTVSDLMKGGGGRLGIAESLSIMVQVLDGLQHVHDRSIVHRDIRPRNILLTQHQVGLTARLAGFGLARDLLKKDAAEDHSDHAKSGTFPYIPREQLRAFAEAPPASDIFGAGATLYRMITGKPAYALEGAPDPIQVILEGKVVPIQEREPGIPPALAGVIDRSVATDPDARHSSAAEFRAALQIAAMS